MNYFKDCTTLDEAKKLYWDFAKKLHPDKGGSEEAFKLLGNEFDAFRPQTEKFKAEFEQWDSKEYASIIEALITIPELEIEICGSWIWLSGETKKYKEQIKEIDTGDSYRRGWSKNKLMWYFSPSNYRKFSNNALGIDEIRNLYGSETIKSKGMVRLPV